MLTKLNSIFDVRKYNGLLLNIRKGYVMYFWFMTKLIEENIENWYNFDIYQPLWNEIQWMIQIKSVAGGRSRQNASYFLSWYIRSSSSHVWSPRWLDILYKYAGCQRQSAKETVVCRTKVYKNSKFWENHNTISSTAEGLRRILKHHSPKKVYQEHLWNKQTLKIKQ